MSQRQKKQVGIGKFMCELASNAREVCLERLVAMNAMKTELRLYTLAIIIAVDTILSSAERIYFDGVAN